MNDTVEELIVKIVVGLIGAFALWFYGAIVRKVQARNPARKVARSIIILLDERKTRRNDKNRQRAE